MTLPPEGPRERHLRRRRNNPLFAPERREISPADWEQARSLDAQQREAFLERFRALVTEAAATGDHQESEQVLDLKARLDHAYAEASALGSGLETIKGALQRLIAAVMRAIAAGAQGDQRALRELDEEGMARAQHVRLLAQPLVADLMLPDSTIPPDELAPTLLSANEEELHAAVWLFDPEAMATIVTDSRRLIEAAAASGADVTTARARLALIEHAANGE